MARPDRAWLRTTSRAVLCLLGVSLIGAVVGFVVAAFSPARVEIAGSDARVWVRFGQDYDQFGIDRVLTGKRTTTRSVLGEPLGVHAVLDLDASVLTDSSGVFNADILPAYIQAYSDPEELVSSVRHAVVQHFVVFVAIGAVAAEFVFTLWRGYRAWRGSYDRIRWPDPSLRALARAYRAPERTLALRLTAGVALLLVLTTIPSAAYHPRGRTHVTGDPLLAGTPLASVEVQGLLRPALVAARTYIETYFDETNSYYDALETEIDRYLTVNPTLLPGGVTGSDTDQVLQFGFVTDRHCNIGMDRVIVALLQHFEIHTLVSGGDDAFSGSFGFEAACTRNLAEKSKKAHITDVFVGGNHDSPLTISDEAKQHIETLTGKVIGAGGAQFLGLPDPRTSRYGQGIVPSSNAAQQALLTQQGSADGSIACAAHGWIVAVLHDPEAGAAAMQHGCGHITVALDGHTHKQAGPNEIPLPDGGTGYQFTGASTGGAPTESSIEQSLASRLTVGPLNHDASVDIVSIDRVTGALKGVTEFTFTPDQAITVSQQLR